MEVVIGNFWISLSTSNGSTGSKLDNTDGDNGGGQDIVDAIPRTLSAKQGSEYMLWYR